MGFREQDPKLVQYTLCMNRNASEPVWCILNRSEENALMQNVTVLCASSSLEEETDAVRICGQYAGRGKQEWTEVELSAAT